MNGVLNISLSLTD